VTEHSENIGVFNELEDPNSPVSHSDAAEEFKALQTSMTETDDDARDTNEQSLLGQFYTLFSSTEEISG
jgi:hypothetical protein